MDANLRVAHMPASLRGARRGARLTCETMAVGSTRRRLEPAARAPLGARHDGGGASFGLFSSVADAVELCVFDGQGARDPV